MTDRSALAAELEPIAARGWPAEREERLGEWRLFASSGYSGRINACWPLGTSGLGDSAAIDAVEAWYADRGLPCRFKIIDGSAPSLIVELGIRGYAPRTATLMMTGDARGGVDARVDLSDVTDGGFAGVFGAAQGDLEDARERLGALRRMPRPRLFAVARDEGPAAIGACAVEAPWAGIFAMRTLADRRRRGLARAVLGALLEAAGEHGGRQVYLQVEAENAPALELYRAAGFAEAYRYRYWDRRCS